MPQYFHDMLHCHQEQCAKKDQCYNIVHYNYGPNNDMETMYVDNRFFEDFKNYMKGG